MSNPSQASVSCQPPSAIEEHPHPVRSALMSNPSQEKPLPLGWKQSLPKADHAWVLKALFKVNTKIGKPELDMARLDKLWWYPPQRLLVSAESPSPRR